ncbi:leucyl-cystinyl aminopeptidase [Pelobates cultripes]|uniref:Leucyl-cystinyl aminopeptidase n=1 Tax=Pelobates cultripes TaxID=61616 RepID=A0AAD1W936_PELCU|nr:leucyl-cystinyl aminopeptidase [Pelobates cultripes]
MEDQSNDRAQLPRNMIENSMFEEEPDVVDLAKEPSINPLESEEAEYEPRSSRLLVRGLGEHDLDEDEEDYESSAKLLGMSFMNRSSGLRNNGSNFRQVQDGLCPVPSVRTVIVCVVIVIIAIAVVTVVYLLPKCTFTKEGCHAKTHPMELVYPIATNGKMFPWAKSRLPHSVQPIQYDISLHLNLSNLAFTGTVHIKLNIVENTKNIILHSSGLQITKTSVTLAGKSLEKVEVLEYLKAEQIAIVLPEIVTKGKECVLAMEYISNFSNTYYGLYKVSYKEDKDASWLAATQFEPLAARKVFPCFDEPAFKSAFQIRIRRSEEHISLSNMPKTNTTKISDGLFQDEFATSVSMSTYLVAFVVAEMKNISKELNETMVSVYAIPQKMDQVQFALDAATKFLQFYQDYFSFSYPLKKLDLVAIPDFQAGAMENWGLITFRETDLLYNENTSSIMDKQLIGLVIAHELAHQWFGNLVTMEWWNDLWLNEGFATYMEHVSLRKVYPELNADDLFLTQRFKAMQKDSLTTSHPISTDVQSPEQVEEMFDDLSYIKGAAVLLMLNNFLSEDVFHTCLKDYLKMHKYGSTTSDGLWESMNMITKSNPDVKILMESWTRQAGYPLVTVQKKGKEILLSQERFLQLSNNTLNISTVWNVPLSYITSNSYGSSSTYLLNQTAGKIILPNEESWVKFNVRMTGYYLVDYGQEGWIALIRQLHDNHTVLSPDDRANLIHDIFLIGGLGKVSLSNAFDLISYIVNETDVVPIKEVLHQLHHIHAILDKRSEIELANKVMQRGLSLLKARIDNQTWNDEGGLPQRELRSTLLDFACSYGDKECIIVATNLFNQWKNNGTQLPTDVMKVVFKIGAHTDEGWAYLLQVYMSSSYAAEKLKILEALSSTDNAKKLIWLMQESLRGQMIKSQDLQTVIAYISRNVPGFLVAWNFVKQNWDEITQKFQPGSFPIQTIVAKTTFKFSTEAYLNEVTAFFASTKGKSKDMWCVKEAIENIKVNIQWIEKNLDSLKQWL